MTFKTEKKKRSIVGLDIGSSSIKVVELKEGEGGKFSLVRAKRVAIDPADPDGAARALKKASWGVPLKGEVLVSMITDPRDSFHKLIVPHMPRSELREAIPWELKDQLSLDMKDAEYDFEILRPMEEAGVKKYEVLVAVSPKETIRRHLALLQKIEAVPTRLIQGPTALEAVLEKCEPAGAPIAVLEMGQSNTELSIYRKGALQFSRRLPVSGGDFTKALLVPIQAGQEAVSLTREEAERIKCEYGLCQDETLTLPDSPVRPSHILPLVRPVAERLASELERSLIFYQEKSGGEKIARLLLFGGGASLKGLTAFFSNALGMEVVTRNPFEKVPMKGPVERVIQEAPLEFTLALGAALSGEGGVNLLPQEIKEQTQRLVWQATLKGVSIGVALCLFFLYSGMRIELSNHNKKIAVEKLYLSALGPALEEAKQKVLLGDLLNREPYWEDFFRELSHLLPEQAYLESLTMDQGSLSMKGLIVAGKEDAERLLSNLLYSMERGLFHNAALVETEKLGEGKGSSFRIQAKLDQ